MVERVLIHNRSQALQLTIGESRSRKNIEYFHSLIRTLSKLDYVDRRLDQLPDDEEISDRALRGKGIFKPELAICLAGVKRWTKDTILESEFVSDPLLQEFLLSYFPESVRKQFKEEILEHPLAVNVIAAVITNSLIDSVGITFTHRMCISHSAALIRVIQCAIAAQMILGSAKIRKALEVLDSTEHTPHLIRFVNKLGEALREGTSWLLSAHDDSLSLVQLVEMYREPFTEFVESAEEILPEDQAKLFRNIYSRSLDLGVGEFASRRLALFSELPVLFESIRAAHISKHPLKTVMSTYSLVLQTLQLEPLP